MKFKHGTRRRALEYEKDWVARWKADRTFEKSVENRPLDNSYVFYDGPPFISGSPHHGTLLSSIVKDAIPRYQTMKGKRVERVWGWDCHGLPAERFTEKKLGIHSRQEVIEYGIENYINATRKNMEQTSSEWEDVVDRIGRWVDFKGAYKTMDKDYMESIWWAFKTLHEKGKIYEGEKVLMYCTLDGTPLSKAEVTMDAGAYQDVTDPSVYVKFRIVDENSTQVYFVRHGQTDWNFSHKIMGRADIELNDVGKEQARETAENLKDEKFDIIISSPLQRAKQTAEIIKSYHKDTPLVFADELLERDFGEYEGKKNPGDYFGLWNYGNDKLEKGETTNDVEKRIFAYLENLKKKYAGKKILVVAHGGIGLLIQAYFSGIPKDNDLLKLVAKNGELKKFTYNTINLLAWTTTPWTLPANTALAVNKDVVYVEVQLDGERFIVAKDLVKKVFTDEKNQPLEYTVVREMKGEELVGLSYEPLIAIPNGMGYTSIGKKDEKAGDVAQQNAALVADIYKIHAADYVETEAGTGIVHIAPTYGEEDYELAKRNNVPGLHVVDENGFYYEPMAQKLYEFMPWRNADEPLNVWESNKDVAKSLKKAGIVWKIDYITHSYPHCHRCGTKLMYRAHPSWFMDIDGQREKMLEKNEPINWFPQHVKHGRFEKTVESAPDWNISRDRFWATAMPVWKAVDEHGSLIPGVQPIVVGDYDELEKLSGKRLPDYHRPWIDDVEIEKDGVRYKRIDKVMDSWFEAGSMPFAQFHYPFENKEKFEANFPGDFIVEYIGQVRAWFYYMHAMSIALFGQNSFKNVIVTGNVAGNDGRKMSKSYGNYTDPNELMDKFSADSLRFLLLSSPLLNGEDFALQDKEVGDVARKLSMVWNMYDFFTMYAEVDGWEYDGELTDPLESLKNPLDIWIVSRLHQLVAEVERHMDAYNIPDAMSPILPFLDDASNWFVRRSRRRFWKSEDDTDKNDAYRTLHYVLVRLSYVLAPFTPFLAEELYHNLTGDEESVHLKDWLPAGNVNEAVATEMEEVRGYVNEGLGLRAKAGLKVRQPLASVTIPKLGTFVDYTAILTEELNVKTVKEGKVVAIDETLTPELEREGMMREIIRHVQSARKSAGLNVDDRITLGLIVLPGEASSELEKAIEEHSATIAEETLTETFADVQDGHDTSVKVEGIVLRIVLKKA